VAVPIVNIRF